MVPGDCTTGIPFGPTPVCALARNDISGSAFVNPPVLSSRVRRREIEGSSGLTMVMSFLGPLLEGGASRSESK